MTSFRCLFCSHFQNDAAFFEAVFKGVSSLSSGHASVRSDDGLCHLHDRLTTTDGGCPQFSPK